MAKFVLTAQLQLQAPTNTNKVINDLRQRLAGVKIPVEIKGAVEAQKQIEQVSRATREASGAAVNMGKSFGLAFKRFAAFTVASRTVSLFTNSLANSIDEAINFQREMVRLAQVTQDSDEALRKIENRVFTLARNLGVASKDLINVTMVLAQAGLKAKDLDIALEALAKTALTPTFGNIAETAEGAIAILAQFKEGVGALERQFGAINRVSADFAVESEDLIDAVRRFGGVFKASGGSLEELIALFTSVRATTRESAESISTGLRTIFTRIQRPKTIEFLRQFGVELETLDGKFVGPYEAVRQLSEAIGGLEEGDIQFVRIAEELGGFRQIGKVIPLLREFETAERARQSAVAGGDSLNKDAIKAQEALAIQFLKVREQFQKLIQEVTNTATFQAFAKTTLNLASALISLADAIKPVLPLLGAIAAFKTAQSIGNFAAGFGSAVRGVQSFDPRRKNAGGKIHAFARGGMVPGTGNRDTVPAMLTPGEFVIRKSSVNKIGANKLAAMNANKYAKGGKIQINDGQIGGFFLQPEEGSRDYEIPKTKTVKVINAKALNQLGLGIDASNKSDLNQILFNLTKKQQEKLLGIPLGNTLSDERLKNKSKLWSSKGVPDDVRQRIDSPEIQDKLKSRAYRANTSPSAKTGRRGRSVKVNAQDVPISGKIEGFYPGGSNVEKNAEIAGLIDGVAKQILANGVAMAAPNISKSLDTLKPSIDLNDTSIKSAGDRLSKDDNAVKTLGGFLFEGVIQAISGAKLAGGQSNFDFPARSIASAHSKLAQIFTSSNDNPAAIQKLIKADAKRSANTKTFQSILDKVVNDINIGKYEGVNFQKFAKGGKAKRNVGYIDGDVLNDPKNEAIVQAQIDKLGIKGGVAGYKQYLGDLAAQSRKSGSLGKLSNIVGMAGSGKSSLMLGNQAADNATLRQTTRFPILTPEDIAKASSVINVSAAIGEKDIANVIDPADRTFVLSSSTKEEQDILRSRRKRRDKDIEAGTSATGFGRRSGSTKGAPVDSGYMEALIQSGAADPKKIATMGVTKTGFRRKIGAELPKVLEEKINLYYGNFGPASKGHELARQEGLKQSPGAKSLVAVGIDSPLKEGDEHSYRSALMSQKERAAMAQQAFPGAYIAKANREHYGFSLPSLYDVGTSESGQRTFIKPAKGSTATVGEEKDEKSLAKYKNAGFDTINLPRIEGISGTKLRDAILSNNLGEVQKLTTSEGFNFIKDKMSTIKNRADILPEIMSRVSEKSNKKLAAIESELTKYPTRMSKTTPQDVKDKVEELRKQREKVKSAAGNKPLAMMDRLKKLNPKKYGFAKGGAAPSDTVPALLTPGEFVVNRTAAQKIGYGNLHRMNKQGVAGFAKGGAVGVQRFQNGGDVDTPDIPMSIQKYGDPEAYTKHVKIYTKHAEEIAKLEAERVKLEKEAIDLQKQLNDALDKQLSMSFNDPASKATADTIQNVKAQITANAQAQTAQAQTINATKTGGDQIAANAAKTQADALLKSAEAADRNAKVLRGMAIAGGLALAGLNSLKPVIDENSSSMAKGFAYMIDGLNSTVVTLGTVGYALTAFGIQLDAQTMKMAAGNAIDFFTGGGKVAKKASDMVSGAGSSLRSFARGGGIKNVAANLSGGSGLIKTGGNLLGRAAPAIDTGLKSFGGLLLKAGPQVAKFTTALGPTIAATAIAGTAVYAFTSIVDSARGTFEQYNKSLETGSLEQAVSAKKNEQAASSANKAALGAVAAGAAIGSVFPGIGTAAGAAIGAIVGIGIKLSEVIGIYDELANGIRDSIGQFLGFDTSAQIDAQIRATAAMDIYTANVERNAKAQDDVLEQIKSGDYEKSFNEAFKSGDIGKNLSNALQANRTRRSAAQQNLMDDKNWSAGELGGALAMGPSGLAYAAATGAFGPQQNITAQDVAKDQRRREIVDAKTGRKQKETDAQMTERLTKRGYRAEDAKGIVEATKATEDEFNKMKPQFAQLAKNVALSSGEAATFDQFLSNLPDDVRSELDAAGMTDDLQKEFDKHKKAVIENIKYIESLNFGLRDAAAAANAMSVTMDTIAASQDAGFNSFANSATVLEQAMTSAGKNIEGAQLDAAIGDLESSMRTFGVSDKQIAQSTGTIRGIQQAQKNTGSALQATQAILKKNASAPADAIKDVLGKELLKGITDPEAADRLKKSIDNLDLSSEETRAQIQAGNLDEILKQTLDPVAEAVTKQAVDLAKKRAEAETKLIDAVKKRQQQEQEYIAAQRQAIDTQLEAGKLFEEFGGAKLTTDQKLGARTAQANLVLENAKVGGLQGGNAQDIRRAFADVNRNYAAQQEKVNFGTLGVARNARDAQGRAIGPAMAGAAGVDADTRDRLKEANKALIEFTKQRVDLIKEELAIAEKKNKAEKDALDKLLSGDIEGFLEGQLAATAGAALRMGDTGIASAFGAGALGAGYQTLQDQGLSDREMQRAASLSLSNVGVTDQRAAQVLSGTTAQEEALKAEGRDLAQVLGEGAQMGAQLEKMDVTAANVVIEAQNIQLERFNQPAPAIGEPIPGKAKGGLIYASNGMFIKRGTDTVPAMLTPGEFVVNRSAVERGNNLAILQAMNGGMSAPGGMGMSRGGMVYMANGGLLEKVAQFTLNGASSLSRGLGGPDIGQMATQQIGALQTQFSQNIIDPLKKIFEDSPLGQFANSFQQSVDKLMNFQLNVKVDPTNVTVNFQGASFLATLKEDIKKELLAKVVNELGKGKFNESGELKVKPGGLA